MKIRLIQISVAVLCGSLISCGVASNGSFTAIDSKEISSGLITPTTTTTTTTLVAPVDYTSTTIVQETSNLFYVQVNLLTSVPLYFPSPMTASAVLNQLLAGQIPINLRTSIPAGIQAVVTVERGIAVVSVTRRLLSDTSKNNQILAIGQIVLTLTSMPGTGQVQFVVDGVPIAVPRADGSIASATQPVTFDDYSTLVAPVQ